MLTTTALDVGSDPTLSRRENDNESFTQKPGALFNAVV
jgi:hypothetical protein